MHSSLEPWSCELTLEALKVPTSSINYFETFILLANITSLVGMQEFNTCFHLCSENVGGILDGKIATATRE